MLWIGICLPRLSLEVFERGSADPLPLAICDSRFVLSANDAAQALGVREGLKRATALALCPSLRLAERTPARERESLMAVAMWALQFTPQVSLQATEPFEASQAGHGLLLEAAGSLRLFGGKRALAQQLREGLAAQGHAARLSMAPVPLAAWLLALHGDSLEITDPGKLAAGLSHLPATLLGPGREHWEVMQGIGVRTFGDLLRLPRLGLTRRFGAGLLDEIDRALGRKPDPRLWFVAPVEFSVRQELQARVDNAEALLFTARRLLVQLEGWLAARHAAVRSVAIGLIHDDRPASEIALRLATPTRDAAHLTVLLRERLNNTTLAAPVYEMALASGEVVIAQAGHGELFPAPQSAQEGHQRLIERLQARLGHAQLRHPVLVADHRPESAHGLVPAGSDGDRPGPGTSSPASGARPLWLLPEPLPLAERNHQPFHRTPLKLLAGPERIEGGWWDGRMAERDYFIAEDGDSALFWIYRLRAPDPDTRTGWFLQGCFG